MGIPLNPILDTVTPLNSNTNEGNILADCGFRKRIDAYLNGSTLMNQSFFITGEILAKNYEGLELAALLTT